MRARTKLVASFTTEVGTREYQALIEGLEPAKDIRLLMECLAFQCSLIYRVGFNSLGGIAADNLTWEVIQRISSVVFHENPEHAEGAAKWMSGRVTVLSRHPELVGEDCFKMYQGASGDHYLVVLDLLNLQKEKWHPTTMIRLLKGKGTWVDALKVYQEMLGAKGLDVQIDDS